MEELNKNVINEGQTSTETQEEKHYTQAEVDELLQKEVDRRITSALKKQEVKNAQRVREAEKVAQMSAEEKYRYELEQREAAIEAKEKELTLAENRNVCSKILADKGLSLDLVSFVVAEDAETMNANIKVLERAFKTSVKNELEKRLGASTPKVSTADPASITRQQFSKMTLSEQNKLYKENPEIYNQLTNF